MSAFPLTARVLFYFFISVDFKCEAQGFRLNKFSNVTLWYNRGSPLLQTSFQIGDLKTDYRQPCGLFWFFFFFSRSLHLCWSQTPRADLGKRFRQSELHRVLWTGSEAWTLCSGRRLAEGRHCEAFFLTLLWKAEQVCVVYFKNGGGGGRLIQDFFLKSEVNTVVGPVNEPAVWKSRAVSWWIHLRSDQRSCRTSQVKLPRTVFWEIALICVLWRF